MTERHPSDLYTLQTVPSEARATQRDLRGVKYTIVRYGFLRI